MEVDLAVLCQFCDDEVLSRYQAFLEQETRPLLDDDVAPAYRDLFNILDDIDDVELSDIRGNKTLALHWLLGGRDFVTDSEAVLEGLLEGGGITALVASIYLDGELTALVKGKPNKGLEFQHDVGSLMGDEDDMFVPLEFILNRA